MPGAVARGTAQNARQFTSQLYEQRAAVKSARANLELVQRQIDSLNTPRMSPELLNSAWLSAFAGVCGLGQMRCGCGSRAHFAVTPALQWSIR